MYLESYVDFLKTIGFEIKKDKLYSFDEASDIYEAVGDHLAQYGFDANDEPNEVGWKCENIIDIFIFKMPELFE